MGAPPPPLLDALPRFGVWSGLERRVFGNPPQSYSLSPNAESRASLGLTDLPEPEAKRPTLALLGQWRLEGG
jgi:hypothetical protein